ncbi:hypothetical protein GPX89_17160 [Nocardia sp. ET3-3]|uniref:Secreted protein n=1 Tax=Nocardia terrae TaxID=2675851 RepID=A0A7K1UXQ7_9NOCA|nr:hypothetical protein [Nocardia terrae]MVU78969.1 hypothetical protein [Nocardia terrae]
MVVRGAALIGGIGVAASAVVFGMGSPQASAGPAARDSQVIDCTGRAPAVRPDKLEPGCSASHQYLTDIGWRAWGSDVAVGEGMYHANKCEPACAAGNFETMHAWVVLSDPTSSGMFTKVTVSDDKGQWTTSMPVR